MALKDGGHEIPYSYLLAKTNECVEKSAKVPRWMYSQFSGDPLTDLLTKSATVFPQ